jgi:hypothetical protein
MLAEGGALSKRESAFFNPELLDLRFQVEAGTHGVVQKRTLAPVVSSVVIICL